MEIFMRTTARRAAPAALAFLAAAACAPVPPTPPSGPDPIAVEAPPGADPAYPMDWWRTIGPRGSWITLGSVKPGAGISPTVVLVHGTGGLSVADQVTAYELVAKGYTVVIGSWTAGSNLWGTAPWHIDCPFAPAYSGMSRPALDALDGIVNATRLLPGVDPTRVGIIGFSRGGGLAELRAAMRHRPEPVVSIYGVVDGPLDPVWGATPAGELYASDYAAGLVAETRLVHGTADRVVPYHQAVAMRDAAQAAGIVHVPELTLLRGQDHFTVADNLIVDAARWLRPRMSVD